MEDASLKPKQIRDATVQPTPARNERSRHVGKRFMLEEKAETSFLVRAMFVLGMIGGDASRAAERGLKTADKEITKETQMKSWMQRGLPDGGNVRTANLNGGILIVPPAKGEGAGEGGAGKDKRKAWSLESGRNNKKNGKELARDKRVAGRERGGYNTLQDVMGCGDSGISTEKKNKAEKQGTSQKGGCLTDSRKNRGQEKYHVQSGKEVRILRGRDVRIDEPSAAVRLAWLPGDPCSCVGAPGVVGEACRGWLRARAVAGPGGREVRVGLKLVPRQAGILAHIG